MLKAKLKSLKLTELEKSANERRIKFIFRLTVKLLKGVFG